MSAPASSPDPRLMFVDLDGTLVRTDTLLETTLAAIAARPAAFLAAVPSLLGGRARFKRALSDVAVPDAARLPYRREALDLVRERRTRGWQIVLATAADETVARAVAAHLGCFDAVIASDGATNMRGRRKRDAIVAFAGGRPFELVGDADEHRDLWRAAARAHVVGARAAQAAGRATAIGTVFPDRATGPRRLLRAMRARHWLKNLLLFAPPLFAHRFSEPGMFAGGAIAFVAFSAAASAVYLVNDCLDASSDRAHPSKRSRPVASGELSPGSALRAAAACALLSALSAAFLSTGFLVVLAVYAALSTAYSLRLKRHPGFDLACLASFYVLRVIAGGAASGVPVSGWLVAFSWCFFFSLGSAKRTAELAMWRAAGRDDVPGRGYGPGQASAVAAAGIVSAALAVAVVALYAPSRSASLLYERPLLILAAAAVIGVWLARLWRLASRGRVPDDPFMFTIADRFSYGTAALVAAIVAAAA